MAANRQKIKKGGLDFSSGPLFLPPPKNKARRLAILFLVLAPFLFGALALYLGQDANWDFRNYHWYNAYALLNGRYDIDLLPAQTPSFYNPALDVPFFLLASSVPAKVAGFILGTVQGLNFILIFMLAHATLRIPSFRQKVLACVGLAALGLLGGGGIAQIGTSFYDNITSLGLFASALLVLRLWQSMQSAAPYKALFLALLCGFPAGLMMGCKLPFVTFCIGLCGAILFVGGPLGRRIWIAFGFGLGVLLGLVLSLGPWALFLYERYGSPLFPYFNNFFGSPLAPDTSARDVQFIPGTWSDRLFFPFIFMKYPTRVGEIPWQDLRIPLLYALLPLAVVSRLLFGRNKHAPDRFADFVATRYLLWLAILSYGVWLFLFAIYRYLLPLEMLAPLLIVLTVGLMPLRLQTRTLLTAFLLLAVTVTVQAGNWGRKEPWLNRAVEATIPEIKNPENTMILMAGFDPYSHVLTEFPPEIAFVRVQSNFASPDEAKGINKIIKDRVLSHKGAFKLLVTRPQFNHAEFALRHFGLTFSPQNCQAVVDHLFDSKLELCDVQKTANKPVKP